MNYFTQPFKYLYKRHALTPFRKQFWQVPSQTPILLLLIIAVLSTGNRASLAAKHLKITRIFS